MIAEFNHVGLSVSNLERSMAFYRDLLGMEVVIQAPFEGGRYEIITALKGAKGRAVLLRLKNTSLQVELFEFSHPKPKPSDLQRPVCDHGITHFCMSVENIDSEYERLKAAGVQFHCAPLESPTAKVTYGRDPDGNVFELLEKRQPAHDTDPQAVVQRQLDAFNARDIEALLASWADDARMFEHPSKLLASGNRELRERFESRFREPDLRAVLLKRIAAGSTVIDHEIVTRNFPEGRGESELIMIYEVIEGRIVNVWRIACKS